MVEATTIAGIFGFLGTLILGFLYTTLWTWRHAASLGGGEEERVVNLESHRKSRLDNELTELFVEIDNKLDDPSTLPPDISKQDHVANVIHRSVGRDDLESVVSELDKVDDPKDIFDDHKQAYRTASKHFLIGCLATIGLAALIAGVTIWMGQPFASPYPFAYFVVVLIILDKGHSGITDFQDAQTYKDEFEQMWREYKRVD